MAYEDAAEESQKLTDKNRKLMEDTKALLDKQREEIKEIGEALQELGIDLSSDLPLEELSDDQRAELDSFLSEIDRVTVDLESAKKTGTPKSSGVGKRVKVLI